MLSYLCAFLLDKEFFSPEHFAFVRTISVEIRPGLIKAISLLFCIKTSGKHCLCFAVPCEAPLNVLRRCFQLQEPHVLSQRFSGFQRYKMFFHLRTLIPENKHNLICAEHFDNLFIKKKIPPGVVQVFSPLNISAHKGETLPTVAVPFRVQDPFKVHDPDFYSHFSPASNVTI